MRLVIAKYLSLNIICSSKLTENVVLHNFWTEFPENYLTIWLQTEISRFSGETVNTQGAYHLARKPGNFGLKSNGKVIFRKFHSEIVEYLQRYSSFSVRNGTAEISLPFAKLSSFQSLISWKQLREIEVQMVSAISFGWFADFGKTLTIIQRSSQPVYSDKW